MRRHELEESILKASEVVGQSTVFVFGSQAILASFEERRLPTQATMSAEADIAPVHDLLDHLTSRLWVEAGQDSEWANERGFYIDAVSAETAILPPTWRDRAIELSVPGHPGVIGICPEAHDLCASKLARNEEKDRDFVRALTDAGLVDARRLRARFDALAPQLEPARARVARRWILDREEEQRSARN